MIQHKNNKSLAPFFSMNDKASFLFMALSRNVSSLSRKVSTSYITYIIFNLVKSSSTTRGLVWEGFWCLADSSLLMTLVSVENCWKSENYGNFSLPLFASLISNMKIYLRFNSRERKKLLAATRDECQRSLKIVNFQATVLINNSVRTKWCKLIGKRERLTRTVGAVEHNYKVKSFNRLGLGWVDCFKQEKVYLKKF